MVWNAQKKFIKLLTTVGLWWSGAISRSRKSLANNFLAKSNWPEKLTKGICNILLFSRFNTTQETRVLNRVLLSTTKPFLCVNILSKWFLTVAWGELVQYQRQKAYLIWHPVTTFKRVNWMILYIISLLTVFQVLKKTVTKAIAVIYIDTGKDVFKIIETVMCLVLREGG